MTYVDAMLRSTHVCDWSEGECQGCASDARSEAVELVRSARGRWLVVFEGAGAARYRRRSQARATMRQALDAGVPARVIRYRRDRVTFDETMPGLEVNDARWLP